METMAISQKNALEIQASLNNALQLETPPPVEPSPVGADAQQHQWKPERYVPPHLRKFVESDKIDAAQIARWRNGDDPGETRWLAPGIPTTYYAHTLAKEHGISHTAHEVFESKCEPGIWYACVWTFNPKNQRLQIGAAYWHDADTAKFFAYRNSIRQQLVGLCLQIGKTEKKTWQAKDRSAYRNAVKRHA